jgi:hypothetical protein
MATAPIFDSDGVEQTIGLPGDYNSSDHVKVCTADDVITLTPTIDTGAYADGDTLFDAAAVAMARVSGRPVTLQSVAVTDKDDEGATIDLFFFDSSVTFGTINAAPSISDADALKYLGHVRISSTDYLDVGGAKVACVKGIGLVLEPSGSANIYVAGVIREIKTYTAATDLQFRFGVYQS